MKKNITLCYGCIKEIVDSLDPEELKLLYILKNYRSIKNTLTKEDIIKDTKKMSEYKMNQMLNTLLDYGLINIYKIGKFNHYCITEGGSMALKIDIN